MDELEKTLQSLHDDERNVAVINGYECDDCDETFKTWAKFKEHLPC